MIIYYNTQTFVVFYRFDVSKKALVPENKVIPLKLGSQSFAKRRAYEAEILIFQVLFPTENWRGVTLQQL